MSQAGADKGTVVITDCDHGTIEPERAALGGEHVELRLASCERPEDVAEQAADADVLINQYAPITGAVLDALPSCRLVVRYGVGVDNVDVPAATARGVWVANVPDYGTEEVADHAIALSLALLRGIAPLDRSVRAGGWDYRVARPVRRLSTLTFGVVGCGTIGTAAARKAAALGMRVIGADVVASRPADENVPIEMVSLDELLAAADVVSLHATLTPESWHLIDAARLAAMKPAAYLVNTARGGLVDTRALVAALDSRAIAGAGLDVLEAEPPGETARALTAHERVVLTPHAAWYSEHAFWMLKTEVVKEALRVLHGKEPRCPVNTPGEGSARGSVDGREVGRR